MPRPSQFLIPILCTFMLVGCSDSATDTSDVDSPNSETAPNFDAAFDPKNRTGENAGDELFDMFSGSSEDSERTSEKQSMSLEDELAIANANLDAAEVNLKTKTRHATSREGIRHRMNAIKLNAEKEAAQGYLDILDD